MPTTSPHSCRLCGASNFRRLTHRAVDGSMAYSGIYRCSGCSVTFTDPADWKAPTNRSTAPDATQAPGAAASAAHEDCDGARIASP